MAQLVDNWEAAESLQLFKSLYLDPLKKKWETEQAKLDDPELFKDPKLRASQEKLVQRLEGQTINFSLLHSSVLQLIARHEGMVDFLTEFYQKWFYDISAKGEQPKEMLSLQAEILQEMFVSLYNTLKPLGVDLAIPKEFK